MFDTLITGGTVVDGSGQTPRQADVAVRDGVIVATGEHLGDAASVLDATGCIVTPGFVDLHTHLDAQLAWDPDLTPSAYHGVTSVVIGNCGVTFAPVRPGHARVLAEMMESVEDIPRSAILEGMAWDWESFGEFLGGALRNGATLNVGGIIGHSALRLYAMGERGVEEQATPEDLSLMARLVGEAIDDGALGFSTSRCLPHVLPDGRCIPGTFAAFDEIYAIAEAMGEHGGGLFQGAFNLEGDADGSVQLIREATRRCGRGLFNSAVGDNDEDGRHVDQLFETGFEGLDVRAICIPRASGALMTLGSLLPYHGPGWAEWLAANPTTHERAVCLQDDNFLAQRVDDINSGRAHFRWNWLRPIGVGPHPEYSASPTIAEEAAATGEQPATVFLRHLRDTDGQTQFTYEMFNRNRTALSDFLRSDAVLPGLGDAGAHVSQVMDAGWTSYMLLHWVRDTAQFELASAVRQMSALPAQRIGLTDRGLLAPGFKADINVIDLPNLSVTMPTLINDIPGGHNRLTQRATGYRATLVSGAVVVRDDELTGARPGELIRS